MAFIQKIVHKINILRPRRRGYMLVTMIIYGSIAIMLMTAMTSAVITMYKMSQAVVEKERTFHIAESGNEYYRWHLAHAPADFKDGTTTSSTGPYIHQFKDIDGNIIGRFELTITAPINGTTITTVRSKGVSVKGPVRQIETKLAIPSMARFAVVANDNMRFGEGTEVHGPIHVNAGVRFDGYTHNIISSTMASYDDPDHTGGSEFGVHTHVVSGTVNETFRSLEAPPNAVQARTDVFAAGRQFPVPQVDFVGITTSLSSIKTAAQSGGKYLASSGANGYHIVLKTNGTYDLYKVTTLQASPSSSCTQSATDWGTWTIKSTGGQTLIGNYAFPVNGLIFVEDHVWVDGQISNKKLTIASGKFPDNASTRTSIIINNDLKYTYFDGRDVLGLIAQDNVLTGLGSLENLTIHGALVAQYGKVGRMYYNSDCSTGYVRTRLTLYGMIASYLRYGFAYTDNTGYDIRDITYDANMLYGPPPSFPLLSGQYQTISWEEMQ
jgi:hypothetical protein